jgi:hypothetical protein
MAGLVFESLLRHQIMQRSRGVFNTVWLMGDLVCLQRSRIKGFTEKKYPGRGLGTVYLFCFRGQAIRRGCCFVAKW